jgi:hypothetical protein
MPKIRVTLSIGYPTATRVDIIDVDDTEYQECETDEEREDLLQLYWQEWANNYIDGGVELVEE